MMTHSRTCNGESSDGADPGCPCDCAGPSLAEMCDDFVANFVEFGHGDATSALLALIASATSAIESRAAELEAALRALVSVQAACMVGACGDPSCTGCDVPCTAPATRFSGCMLACDAHGEDFDDTGNAAALRAALLLLAKGG